MLVDVREKSINEYIMKDFFAHGYIDMDTTYKIWQKTRYRLNTDCQKLFPVYCRNYQMLFQTILYRLVQYSKSEMHSKMWIHK